MGLVEFLRKYPNEAACITALRDLKWPSGFACQKCNATKAHHLASRPRVFECASCGHQHSVTAGTVLHKTRTDLTKWFLCAFLMAADKRGVAALHISRQLGIRYDTAWTMCHKLRAALFEREDFRLCDFVECDEAFYGGYREKGARGRGRTAKKSMFVLAVEKRAVERNGRIRWVAGDARIEVIPAADAATLAGFAARSVTPGASIITDGWAGYKGLAAAGYEHQPLPGNGAAAGETLPLVHILISNLKAWLNGTFHGVSKKHLPRYLREWSYRFNRRHRDVAGDVIARMARQPGVPYQALTQ